MAEFMLFTIVITAFVVGRTAVHQNPSNTLKIRNYFGLLVSIVILVYAFVKKSGIPVTPRVGPVGNPPDDAVITAMWVLFGVSMVLGISGIIFFTYSLLKKK
jgi:hypothetical protein